MLWADIHMHVACNKVIEYKTWADLHLKQSLINPLILRWQIDFSK